MPKELLQNPSSVRFPVMEQFYTIQGEGTYTGHAAYFIRLGGCDVGCVWCDVKESWDAEKHSLYPVEEIVNKAASHPARIAVITGGEPFMYELSELIQALKSEGFRVHIETSGAYPCSGNPDWICVSPKKFKAPLDEVLALADELKVVIFNQSDFNWAVQHQQKAKDGCQLFLQPEWEKRNKVTPLIVDFVKHHPAWQISLQTHKYLDIP
jgi:7-carboxy-7-deazaguanine synthase